MIKPSIEEVMDMDISSLYALASDNDDNRRLLEGEAGVEHYKLLAWISMQFVGAKITEVGTLGGLGTIALSFNKKNKVTSYDLRSYKWGNQTPENAEKKIVHDGWMDEVMESSLIFYDAAHEGKDETIFLNDLLQRGWKGTIVWDDIHLNDPMRTFWNSVQELQKNSEEVENHPLKGKIIVEDWTLLGHSSGTGVIILQ